MDFRLTRGVALQWALISTVGFFFFVYLFSTVYAALTGRLLDDVTFYVSGPGGGGDQLLGIGLFLGLTLGVVVLHELVHGAFMRRYGSTPEYGAGVAYFVLPYAYARSEGTYARNETLVILLAPLVLLSVAGIGLLVVFPTPWLLVPLAANAAGSIGDIWMALVLLQYPADVRMRESSAGTGFQIYGAGGTGSGRSIGQVLTSIVHGAVIGFGAVAGVIVFALVGSIVFGIESLTLGLPNSEVFLFRLTAEGGVGASFELGFPLIAACCGIFGLGYALVTSLRS